MVVKVKFFCTIIGTMRAGEGFVPRMNTNVLSEIALSCCLVGTKGT